MSITYLFGEGGFLSKKKKIIYCINQSIYLFEIKKIILSVDPNAIMKACYVCETSGLDSSLITPKDQHIKNTVLNKFISHIFFVARERMLTLAF
jgi:Uncharacterized protein conserved in bacteria (DUF2179)